MNDDVAPRCELCKNAVLTGKGKICDQQLPSGESAITDSGITYQLLAVMLLK